MSDDRSAIDGWFREVGEPATPLSGSAGLPAAWHREPTAHRYPDELPTQLVAPPLETVEPVGGYRYPEYVPHEHDRRAPGRRRLGVGVTVAAGVTALGLVVYLVLNHGGGSVNAAQPDASASPTHTSFQPSSTDPVTATAQIGAAFLASWQSGDLQKAAGYTDDPTAALASLTAYKSDLNLSGLTLTPQTATLSAPSGPATGTADSTPATGTGSASATMPFSVKATVATSGQNAVSAPWNYTSSLVAYKQADGWSVRWTPSILTSGLTAAEHLKVVAKQPGAGKVVDAGGAPLAASSETALQGIAGTLSKKAPAGEGKPGIAVEITDSAGNAVANSSTTVLKPVDATLLTTTIDPKIQALAQSAVAMYTRSSMVVVQASTGKILAVANSAGNGDMALNGTLAPGSTFKTITTAALLNYGFVTMDKPVGCPLTVTVEGVVYHNTKNTAGVEESLPGTTPFITDFAQSCNNAFTPFYAQLTGGKLAATASTYFGLNQSWDIGLGPASYFNMPGHSTGAELAQETFGQGKIVAAPLAMASVAATIGSGSFHQPYLVDGVPKVGASTLPSATDSALKQAMRAVVTRGTAVGVFSGVSGTVYAKTGTADADANKDGKPNSWMVVYDPSHDVAIGCVVVDSGFGASFAGPEEARVLSRL